MNSNLVHNILNVITVLVAGITAAMVASGCTAGADGSLDCAASWISPEWAGIILALIGAAKLVMNVMRDGVKGLGKQQPPVK